MKISNEIKVGIFAVISLLIMLIGYRYLQNVEIFGDAFSLKVYFEDVDGLMVGNPVTLSGKRAGKVKSIEIDNDSGKVIVILTFEREYPVPIDSKVWITSDLFGTKKIRIEKGKSKTMAQTGANLQGDSEKPLQESILKEIIPLKPKIDSLVGSFGIRANTRKHQEMRIYLGIENLSQKNLDSIEKMVKKLGDRK